MNTQVLIVGAGPTGLTLALWLRRHGVAVRIIDKSEGPGETSRALAVQARTLEFHRQIGISDDALAEGVIIPSFGVRTAKGLAASIQLAKFGEGLTHFPYAFMLPQDVHERMLIKHLAGEGVTVDRSTELMSFRQDESGVTATLKRDGATEVLHAAYLAGCDGAHSVVRHQLGIGFPGGTYDQSFYVADTVGAGDISPGGMEVNLGYGFGVVMPVRQRGSFRLIGVIPQRFEGQKYLTFEDIRTDVERDTGVTVQAVNWFSTYRVHHRVAEKFQVGRAFLVGDAGHVHSPAGGQGMNTGIGDAVNLSWKLAAVLQNRAKPELLDTYEPERIAFAHLLIKSTDKAFRVFTSTSPLVSFFRRHIMAHLVGAITRTKRGGRVLFDTVSQTRIEYRKSALSLGKARALRGGDRLPYVATADGDNHASLSALDWQVQIYGKPSKALTASLRRRHIALHSFAWTPDAKRAGFSRNAIYLVRPDGYIAAIAKSHNEILDHLTRFSIKARGAAQLTLLAQSA